MGAKDARGPSLSWTLLPAKQANGMVVYYACDFSEELGGSVYKGYECTLIKPDSDLKPHRIKKEELEINKEKPVAIKLYDGIQHPSSYQFYASEIAVLKIEERDVLIMEYLDGFHIHPDHKDNPQLKELTFFQAVDIAWQLVLGLNHLHYRNTSGAPVVHGDIKGENIKIRIRIDGEKRPKIDAFYLDLDYAKPMESTRNIAQGTPEHIALEVLNGDYSESSDFFALSPLLLSLFGAYNPLQGIMAFRDRNKHLDHADLIKGFRTIAFSSEGLFAHFEKKPGLLIARLLEQFMLQMGNNNKNKRPSPDSILEFFTALRQFCLVETLDQEPYLLRMRVAAGDTQWLTEKKALNLFFRLDDNLQTRLINLMSLQHSISLYKSALGQHAPVPMIEHLRKNIAKGLGEYSTTLKPPSKLSSFFFSYVSQKDIQWLLSCYERQDYAGFYAAANEKPRVRLQQCNEKMITTLIAIVIEGIAKPAAAIAALRS